MTVAATTREAIRDWPFLELALRAGIVNFTAAARFLDCGETDAVAVALRRYAEEIGEIEHPEPTARVSMQSNIEQTSSQENAILTIASTNFSINDGSLTAIIGEGNIGSSDLEWLLGKMRIESIEVVAAAAGPESAVIIVPRSSAPNTLRIIESMT